MLAHDIHGSGRAVVLLHAILTNREMWHPQLAAWAHRFQVIRVDLPGHGESPVLAAANMAGLANAVWDTLDTALDVQDVSIVGLSLGGMVAQAMALQRPHRVGGLVLAHTSARTDEHGRDLWEQRLASLATHGLEATVGSTLARWFTPEFADRAPLTLAWIADMIRRTPPEGYAGAVRAIQQLDHWDLLPGLRPQTLVVAGQLDKAIPLEVARAFAQRIPLARFEILERAAHLGSVEQATAFTELAGSFLAEPPHR